MRPCRRILAINRQLQVSLICDTVLGLGMQQHVSVQPKKTQQETLQTEHALAGGCCLLALIASHFKRVNRRTVAAFGLSELLVMTLQLGAAYYCTSTNSGGVILRNFKHAPCSMPGMITCMHPKHSDGAQHSQ